MNNERNQHVLNRNIAALREMLDNGIGPKGNALTSKGRAQMQKAITKLKRQAKSLLAVFLLLAGGIAARGDTIPIITVDLGADGLRPIGARFGDWPNGLLFYPHPIHFGDFSALNGPIPADRHVTFDVDFVGDEFIRVTRFGTFSLVASLSGDKMGLGQGENFNAPTRIFGLHYDFDMPPEAGTEITNLHLYTSGGPWAVGEWVPETGSTAAFLGLGLLALMGYRFYRET